MKLFLNKEKTAGFFSLLIYFFQARIIHIHFSHPIKLLIAVLGKLSGKKVLYTIHNQRDLKSFANRMMMKLAYKTIFVADPGVLPLNGIIIPAYIHPPKTALLPDDLREELQKYSKAIVSLSTFSGKVNTQEDLYGFDIILDAISASSLRNDTIIILVDAKGKLRSKYSKRISELEKEKGVRILYYDKEINFPDLLSKSAVFIRATRSDGDAVSVREALYLGIPVIASDCVERPAGCILFKSGEAGDLAKKIPEALYKRSGLHYKQAEFAEVLIELYKGI
jgi:glycosyltransferase involved in cell wall biosynthesis